eukprot:s2072_g2.t1
MLKVLANKSQEPDVSSGIEKIEIQSSVVVQGLGLNSSLQPATGNAFNQLSSGKRLNPEACSQQRAACHEIRLCLTLRRHVAPTKPLPDPFEYWLPALQAKVFHAGPSKVKYGLAAGMQPPTFLKASLHSFDASPRRYETGSIASSKLALLFQATGGRRQHRLRAIFVENHLFEPEGLHRIRLYEGAYWCRYSRLSDSRCAEYEDPW